MLHVFLELLFLCICVELLFFGFTVILQILLELLVNRSFTNIIGMIGISKHFTNTIGHLRHGSNINQYYC